MTHNKSLSSRHAALAAVLALGCIGSASAVMPSVTQVHTFTGNLPTGGTGSLPAESIGSYPAQRLLPTADGWLYGANVFGGGSSNIFFGGGVGGKGSVFYRFKEGSGQEVLQRKAYGDNDGINTSQMSWLQHMTLGSDGKLYSPGWGQDGARPGLWSYVPGDAWGRVGSFSSAEGISAPWHPWLEGPDGRFYAGNGYNHLFAINKDGSGLAVIHQTGAAPEYPGWAPRLLLSHGNGRLYGALSRQSETEGANTLFSIKPDGSDFQALRRFVDAGDPQADTYNVAGLREGPDGWIYGATHRGGTSDTGALFRIKADGSDYELLHSFGGPDANADGVNPTSFVRGADGHFYGTTQGGGINAAGVVFRWHLTAGHQTLFAFDPLTGPPQNVVTGYNTNRGSNATGLEPYSLVSDSTGRLYGVTRLGGDYGWGTIFRFDPGNEVPVFKFRPQVKMGTTVQGREQKALALGLAANINWRGQAVKDCVASSDEPDSSWSGAKVITGGEDYTPKTLGTWTYKLVCQSNSPDFTEPVTQSVSLRVEPVTPDTVKVGSGGGSVPALLLPLLGALALLRRRRH